MANLCMFRVGDMSCARLSWRRTLECSPLLKTFLALTGTNYEVCFPSVLSSRQFPATFIVLSVPRGTDHATASASS
eukprot:2577871-Amphidinium_carterae.1